MNPLNKVHEDWNKIIYSHMFKEPINTLFEKILPNSSYYPKSEDILQMFKMPIKDIKVVIVQTDTHLMYNKIDYSELEQQGVFILYNTLTASHESNHCLYWEDLLKAVISYISKIQPCIWIFTTPITAKFISSIDKKFSVMGYDQNTIEKIPINPDFNYVFTMPNQKIEGDASPHNYYVNSILKNKSLNEIKW